MNKISNKISATNQRSRRILMKAIVSQFILIIFSIVLFIAFKSDIFSENEMEVAKMFNIAFILSTILYFITYGFLLKYLKTNEKIPLSEKRVFSNMNDDEKIIYQNFLTESRYVLQLALFLSPLAIIGFIKHLINCVTGFVYVSNLELLWILPMVINQVYLFIQFKKMRLFFKESINISYT